METLNKINGKFIINKAKCEEKILDCTMGGCS